MSLGGADDPAGSADDGTGIRLIVGQTQPISGEDNPYMSCLAEGLRAEGVECVEVRVRVLSLLRWRRQGLRVLHVQWPEYLGTVRAGGVARRAYNAMQLVRIAAALFACRVMHVPIVWTVHNLRPHDPRAPHAARASYRLVAALASVFIVHSESAGGRAERAFPRARGRTVVAPHGNYAGAYPPSSSEEAAAVRRELGIPEGATVLLAFGRVRPYKRLVELCHAVIEVGDPSLHLLVAGSVGDPGYEQELAFAFGHPQIHFRLETIPAEDVSALYATADLAVLHYGEVFSSGSLLLALTEGVATVARNSAAALEVAEFPAIATYDEDSGLGAAVTTLMAVPEDERSAASRRWAAEATWSRTAEAVSAAYRWALQGPSALGDPRG